MSKPDEGWQGPDKNGFMRFTKHGWTTTFKPPVLEGYKNLFVAVHGGDYTTWTYRPVEKVV